MNRGSSQRPRFTVASLSRRQFRLSPAGGWNVFPWFRNAFFVGTCWQAAIVLLVENNGPVHARRRWFSRPVLPRSPVSGVVDVRAVVVNSVGHRQNARVAAYRFAVASLSPPPSGPPSSPGRTGPTRSRTGRVGLDEFESPLGECDFLAVASDCDVL